jgi:subtilisin family serine protease
MRGPGVLLTAVALALVCAPVAHAGRTGRIIVSLTPGHMGAADEIAATAGVLRDGPTEPAIGMVTLRPPHRLGLNASMDRLRKDPRVRAVAAEGRFELRRDPVPFEPLDPAFGSPEPDSEAPQGTTLQWYLDRGGFPAAWSVTKGEGALVGVIDTGIDATHPDLQGKIAGALDFDDVTDDLPGTDADGHGTHVSSLACAASDNGVGITGAGFNCRVLMLRTDLTDASVARAIVAAADHGVHSLNMSFGDDGKEKSPAVADAVDYAVDRGVVLVAAAADEPIEQQGEPANLLQPTDTAGDLAAGRGLSITAATIDDQRASFAGRGSQISMAAYGALRSDGSTRGIFGLYPDNQTPREQPTVVPPSAGCGCRASFDGDPRYAFLPGTSMAAPQVAAAAALVRDLNPDLGVLDVVRLLKETARRPAAGWSPELGWGIIDASAAVEAARRIDRRAPASRARVTRRGNRSLSLRWSGRDSAPARLLPSGIVRYELWRAVDGGRPTRIATTPRSTRRVRVTPGRKYRFFTIAVDAAGNREPAPAEADLTL